MASFWEKLYDSFDGKYGWRDVLKGSLINSAKEGLAKGIINNKKGGAMTADSQLTQFLLMNNESTKEYIAPTSFSASTLKKNTEINKINYKDFLPETRTQIETLSLNDGYISTTENPYNVNFKTPDWNYGDWINERSMWQRQITSISGEQSWFYFKIFFHFDTQQGLFGGILNNENINSSVNSAGKFLNISNTLNKKLYTTANLSSRLIALRKFTSILSYITSNAPWFFKGIKGLDKANAVYDKEFSKDKDIEIVCNPDAIDMRLSTMMDLYKYAAFDNINCKEIIPENLRKFDMTVLIFNAPIKKIHTAMKSDVFNSFNYKDMVNANTQFENFMSYKMFTFKNCEFNKESLNAMIPGDMNNETPFQLGNNSIKINYDRVYTHNANEFFGLFFGDDGVYFNCFKNKGQAGDLQLTEKTDKSTTYQSTKDSYLQLNRYKILQKKLSGMDSKSILNRNKHKDLIDASEALSNVLFVGGNKGLFEEIGQNTLLGLLEISYQSNSVFGNLYGDVAPGSRYFKDKIKHLKEGTLLNKDYSGDFESKYLNTANDFDHFNLKDFFRHNTRDIKYS